ncbi:hypothetical protein NPIL_496991 [Nephila pilipes]|uniref:Spider venom protein n=1 Tax=Nephila pilipes TaxID=299642 RepID=A0A8X6QH17_NEPPI|nr:hypothetical protein NPIL_496991 [Nephila pilipes]
MPAWVLRFLALTSLTCHLPPPPACILLPACFSARPSIKATGCTFPGLPGCENVHGCRALWLFKVVLECSSDCIEAKEFSKLDMVAQ